jgi:hypothetical protein
MTPDPYRFEREVADLYRSLGADVRHDVSLAGNQIDIVVNERTASGSVVTRIVECKAYSTPVGVHQVRTFALTSKLLRDRHLADVATMVSATSGFTKQARVAAEEFGIDLLEFADLVATTRRENGRPSTSRAERSSSAASPVVIDRSEPTLLRAFVAIPFTIDYDDIYLLAVRAAAESAGISVERADENIESTEIIAHIKGRIRGCDLVIADTTKRNANVFYELGYADGLNKAVLLIAKENARLPFDVQGRNHLLYEGIRDLQAKLTTRFASYRGDYDQGSRVLGSTAS